MYRLRAVYAVKAAARLPHSKLLAYYQDGEGAGLHFAAALAGGWRLLAYYQDGEGAGLHFAAALAGGWRFELGAGEKELVRF